MRKHIMRRSRMLPLHRLVSPKQEADHPFGLRGGGQGQPSSAQAVRTDAEVQTVQMRDEKEDGPIECYWSTLLTMGAQLFARNQ